MLGLCCKISVARQNFEFDMISNLSGKIERIEAPEKTLAMNIETLNKIGANIQTITDKVIEKSLKSSQDNQTSLRNSL